MTALVLFIPFITELMSGLLKPYVAQRLQEMDLKDSRSVHFLPNPTAQESLFVALAEKKVAAIVF